MHLAQFRATLNGLAPATERLTVTIAQQRRAQSLAEHDPPVNDVFEA